MFTLVPLPYAVDALEPHISARTLGFHHDKHHRKYVDTLNGLIDGTAMESMGLPDLILATAGEDTNRAIFNNAAQVWNHDFFWSCMRPNPAVPSHTLGSWIERDFGSIDAFKDRFVETAVAQFGSGWAWLVLNADGSLGVTSTPNAELPFIRDQWPLLTCDVWEHAYYLDYQNRRADFVRAFLDNLVNWDFAATRLAARTQPTEVASA